MHVSMKQKPRILTTYTVTITRRGKKSWNSKLLCWGLDFIFFAQSLTQSIGLCVYAKSSNTRLAASSDAFCAYAVWFFFRCYGLPRVTLRHWRKLLHAQWDTKLCIPPPIKCQLPLFMSCLNMRIECFSPSLTDQCDRPVKWLVLDIIHLLTLGLP